ncbi:hypothetical protein H6G48_07875 [Microcystis flos-aquae FACHB-1344]|jgi:transposase|uniref:Transposase n=1 Tax=Microcystis flos-aquae FACHB-1344 TaxID=2692899 RepID=A0ABR8HQ63_9CHRO|nr:hypothetical protein [Microcystis flos-aquae]MBD2621595.1 hypothetical protein [Microcystis flos-aquae FACHB-1344]
MTKSRNKSSKTQSSDQKLNIINAKAAGIDLGAREHWVCVPQEVCQENTRSFGCTTPDLLLLADWLEECGITSVAMESTGVEWIPGSSIFANCFQSRTS